MYMYAVLIFGLRDVSLPSSSHHALHSGEWGVTTSLPQKECNENTCHCLHLTMSHRVM